MYKTQKNFSPLECGICKGFNCKYREHYEQYYRAGFKVPISDCKRIQHEEERKQRIRGRIDLL